MTLEFHTIILYVTDIVYKMFHTGYIGTKLHIPTCSGSLLLAVRPRSKYGHRAAAMSLIYIQQKVP